jgi:aminoglycoside phosphotransferase (APT) family kinase protein
MVARLPSAEAYALQVPKEQYWLPILAAAVPLPIPRPLALGRPGRGYPWNWSVYSWLPGESAAALGPHDYVALARGLGAFLDALQRVSVANGPSPGAHNCYRGAPLDHYDAEVRGAVARLGTSIDAGATLRAWDRAASSRWRQAPVWLHGDVSIDNLLVRDGSLAAVIDFGCCGVGDPACDLAIAWSAFDAPARAAFRQALPLDAGTWDRARGWAQWKALITLAAGRDQGERARRTLARVLA